jgi:DEAD/DEAH box helicase
MATDSSFPSVRRDALDAARNVLRNTFGRVDFRGLQAGVIGQIRGGRRALAALPTGGGKSLCYQIPALVRSGLRLVVSPLSLIWGPRCQAENRAASDSPFPAFC